MAFGFDSTYLRSSISWDRSGDGKMMRKRPNPVHTMTRKRRMWRRSRAGPGRRNPMAMTESAVIYGTDDSNDGYDDTEDLAPH